ncbi:hypothetical protein HDU91_002282, partial [Kappamyces sp. JEL0680]
SNAGGSSWINSFQRAYKRGKIFSGFLISRFLGDANSRPSIEDSLAPSKPYVDCYGVLKHKTLFIYSDEDQTECVRVILVPQYHVQLYPNSLSEHELFMPQHPIVLRVLPDIDSLNLQPEFYIYPTSSSEKESWFVILRRASRLPPFADSGALSTFYQEIDPVKQYVDAMKKLVSNTGHENGNEELSATAWLNALVGRMFVAIHANPNVTEWVKKRLSRHTVEADDDAEPSLLGDIVIQDLDVGNSLPVLSNPKLVSISVDGDMLIEMDIDYTGGVRLVLATEATLSVPAWDAYMRPITVPIVVAVKINKFSARVLFKIKPFWESNRIWFGFYRQPELKLELEVEPIISNKLIKIQMVNQVIERRIKDSLEAYVMLPNMDDLSFWDFSDLNGSPFGEDLPASVADDSSEAQTMKAALNPLSSTHTVLGSLPVNEFEVPTHAIDASIVGEAYESQFHPSSTLRHRRKNSIANYIANVEKHMHDFEHIDSLPAPLDAQEPED